jgi:hypothetical protein
VNETSEFLGVVPVTVRFEFEPECLGHGAHRDLSAYVQIEEVCIGGHWVSAQYLSDDWLADTERSILAERGKSLQAEDDMGRWEREQERRMEEGYP